MDPSPWSIVRKIIGCVRWEAIPLFVFVEMVSTLWEERNKCQFEGKQIYTPLRMILQNVERFRKGLEEIAEVTKQLQLNPTC